MIIRRLFISTLLFAGALRGVMPLEGAVLESGSLLSGSGELTQEVELGSQQAPKVCKKWQFFQMACVVTAWLCCVWLLKTYAPPAPASIDIVKASKPKCSFGQPSW
jgi:hypothetical protein